MPKITKTKDLIILLLYAKGPSGAPCEPIQGQTRLMKMIFLFKEELSKSFGLDQIIDESAYPKFEAYDFGPYSANVYSDLEFLVNIGLVRVEQDTTREVAEEERREHDYWTATANSEIEIDKPFVGRKFSLSELGKKFVNKMISEKGITENQLATLSQFKKRCCGSSLRSLLRYVYTRYSKMTTESKIKDQVLG